MSNELRKAVAKSDIRPSGRKFVAMALADYANDELLCWPSVEQLAQHTGQGEKTVRDHLNALEQAGVITRRRQHRSDGTLGRYEFKLHRQNLPVADFASGEKQSEPAAKFATRNPQDQPSSSVGTRKPTQFDELVRVLDSERAEAVIAHRKNFKSKFTPYAARLLAQEFAKCAEPNLAAEAMIRNGWRGFNCEWLDRHQPRGSPQPSAPKPPQLADVFGLVGKKFKNDKGPDYEDSRSIRTAIAHISASGPIRGS